MLKNSLLKCLFALACLPIIAASAKENKPLDAFIMRVKETNEFVPVNNIWQVDNNFDKKVILEKVEKAQTLTIDFSSVGKLLQQKTMAISLSIPGMDGKTYSIDLARYDFITNDFQVHTIGAYGKDDKFSYTPGLYYSGVVNGIEGSVAAFSFFNNAVYGVFSIPGEGNYTLVANTMSSGAYEDNPNYILYNDNDLKIRNQGPKCGTDRLPEVPRNSASRTTTTLSNNIYNNCNEVKVFEVGDFAMYQSKGSSTVNVTNYITALFNNQATLYRNEGVPIVLKYVQVNTARDNYQNIGTANSSLFLDTFGKVTQNVLHGADLAILLTTRYGTMGGVAWLMSTCSSYNSTSFYGPYGICNIDNSAVVNFPTYSWDVMVVTHEMGHIVGSPHTHRCCWNPPGTGTTAIDGCYTIEGSCAAPAIPSASVGGTIMSYCHLTSAGINFSNGFGTQPGDTIRTYLKNTLSAFCGVVYNPIVPLQTANRTITANRECTDLASGVSTTYYWKDNNTADQSDDTLVLMIVKNGNNIGGMNTTGFSVSAGTLSGYGSGTGYATTFPSGTGGTGSTNISMRRYWKVSGATAPVSAVEVIFPFLAGDTSDVHGSVPGTPLPLSSYKMYKVNSPIDPNPANGFTGATTSNFTVYNYGTTASTTNWSFSTTSAPTNYAHMKMTNLSGGGTGFYPSGLVLSSGMLNANDGVYIYPNPTSDQWFVSVPENKAQTLAFQLYTVDGKMMLVKSLTSGAINTVSASGLPKGMYYYRITGDNNVYTGSLLKE